MRYVPYSGHGVIVDSNIISAIAKGDRQAGEAKWVAKLNHLARTSQKRNEEFHLWVTDNTVLETTAVQENTKRGIVTVRDSGFPTQTRRLPVTVSQESQEYKSIVQQLDDIGVGKTRSSAGVSDQEIVADIFFSDTRSGVTPTFVTADKGVFTPLCKLNPDCDKALKRGSMFDEFKSGFTVTMKDAKGQQRVMNVIPFSGK